MCTYNICQFSELVLFTINFFSQTSQLLFMFQCNEHVKIKIKKLYLTSVI